MNAFAGVQERTPKEQSQKDEAVARGASRAFVSLTQSQLPDNWQLVHESFKGANDRLLYSTAAVNSILAWLNFPPKLRHFFDCLLVLSRYDEKPFQATNLDIGMQMRVGKGAKAESLQKMISRHKAKLLEWQNNLAFDLIGIERGRFDALRQKNDPTTYTPHILEWVPKILGSVNMREWNKGHLQKLREIRRQAKNFLESNPDCPPLRGYQPKTLSEGQKFDRTDKMLDSMLMEQLMRICREELEPSVYIKYRKNRENHIITNQFGTVGTMLTPEKDVPPVYDSVWHILKTGEITEVIEAGEQKLEEKLSRLEEAGFDHLTYAVEIVKEERRDVKTPRVWDKGSWLETANDFTSEAAETPTGHFSEFESDNLKTGEIRPTKSFEINDHDGTFLIDTEETISPSDIGKIPNDSAAVSEPDFTDWFNDAAALPDTQPITEQSLQNLFDAWVLKVRELVPDKPPAELWKGAWQIYLDLEFMLDKQLEAYKRLGEVKADILAGKCELNDFREAFADLVASGAQYYQNGVTVPQSAQKLKVFRDRLLPHLIIEGG
ncbi:MAG TPA: hypothetical protein VIL74_20760 [Pyrinomonadaceae bacterium]|jgi:hypothetical protein